MNMTPKVLFMIFTVILCVVEGLIFHWLPERARSGMYFNVRVVPQFRKSGDGAHVLRLYRIQTWTHAIMGFALIFWGVWEPSSTYVCAGVLWVSLGSALAFRWARAQVRAHATGLETPKVTIRSKSRPRGSEWVVQLAPFAVLLIAGIFLRTRWNEIPLRFPIHWDFGGQPNAWAGRTFVGVYGILLVAAFVCLLLLCVNYGRYRRLDEEEASRYRRFRLFVAVEYCVAVIFSVIAVCLPLAGKGATMPIAVSAIAIACVLSYVKLRDSGKQDGSAAPRGV